jgi:ribosome maturation factor RimP
VKQALEPIVADILGPLDYELVELRVGGSRMRPILDIRIDRKDLAKISVEDCARASRAIESRLDAMPGAIDGRYVLEVSSPGMERPLRTLADWRRFSGRRANVKSTRLAALGGRAEVEIVGVSEGEGAAGLIVVRDLMGHEHSMALSDVDDARLAFHWNP